MFQILNKQKQRVIDGKYSKEAFIFLVDQALEKGKITQEEHDELITFNEGAKEIQ